MRCLLALVAALLLAGCTANVWTHQPQDHGFAITERDRPPPNLDPADKVFHGRPGVGLPD